MIAIIGVDVVVVIAKNKSEEPKNYYRHYEEIAHVSILPSRFVSLIVSRFPECQDVTTCVELLVGVSANIDLNST